MISMTGYGNFQYESKEVRLEMSIKAVNGRFLECRFHIPKEYVFLEPELKKILTPLFQRGTVDVFCFRKLKKSGVNHRIEIDHGLAAKVYAEINKLQKSLKVNSELTVNDIVSIAPIVKIQEETEVSKNESTSVLKVFKECVDKCHQERIREGHSIKKELLNLLNLLNLEVHAIKKQRAQNAQDLVQKWQDKIKAKGHVNMMDDQKVQQEIFFMTEKADISEEIQRLEEHIKNYKSLLLSKKSEGKKIDFYTQELLREINTVGSKSQSSKITSHVVEAKSLIEKLREQAQNIE